MVVLIVFLIVFFVLLLGMAAFEFGRYSLCCQQFQHCVDIAALGGAAGLASAQNPDQVAAQTVAISTAQWIMERNYVMETPLTGRVNFNASASSPSTPSTANRANINFTWLNPDTGASTTVAGDQKVFQIQGAYSYPPLVGSWIGLGPAALLRCSATGNGGGTQLDVVLCFDLSGSIDDSTIVSYVERWCPGPPGPTNRNRYRQVTTFGTGQMYTGANCPSVLGTSINACYPQSLESTDSTRVSNQGQLRYNPGKRGATQGSPPGPNGARQPTYGLAADTRTLTDLVVNLDENNVFTSYVSPDGYNFPSLGSLVEAARGNLESAAIATAANVDVATLGVTPRPGYYQAYWREALKHRHPLYDAQQSSATFFQILNNSVNAHFGFVGFSSDENTTLNDEAVGNPQNHVFPLGAPGGLIPTTANVPTPIPFVALNPGVGSAFSNFGAVMNFMPPNNPPDGPLTPATGPQLSANGGTDINGALNEALQMLARTGQGYGGTAENISRVGATRAIVLFTDGLPNGNTGPRGAADGIQSANDARDLGIPIYCIGLAQNAALVPTMTGALTPISTISAGKFYQIPPGAGQSAALNRAFADIARSLVSLTR